MILLFVFLFEIKEFKWVFVEKKFQVISNIYGRLF